MLRKHPFSFILFCACRSVGWLRKLCFRLNMRFKPMCLSFPSANHPGQVLFISNGRFSKKHEPKYLMLLETSSQGWGIWLHPCYIAKWSHMVQSSQWGREVCIRSPTWIVTGREGKEEVQINNSVYHSICGNVIK